MLPNQFERIRHIPDGDGNIYVIELPKPPSVKEIANHDKPISDQKFSPPEIPSNFKDMPESEQIAFIRKELNRKDGGYWFYNNGNIEYMTGLHYMYCSWWKIDIGLPHWRDSDRDFFYVWDDCVNNPDSYGLLYICDRRSGKTYKGTSILYFDTVVKKDVNSGIQSKTDKDAFTIFNKLISSWKKLPFFLKPVDSGVTNPKKELRFEEPSKKSTKDKIKEYRDVLNSYIDYASSNEYAYDGTKQYRIYHDEVGKKSNANPYVRWNVVKPCLEVGNQIVGKAYLSSTVEETDREGGEPVKILWDKSNFSKDKLNENKRTQTGLYRYFKPAYYGLMGFIDEYGYSVMDDPEEPILGIDGQMIEIGAKTWITNNRRSLSGQDLNSYRRKYPFTIDDAFVLDSKGETFPSHKIYEQKDYNSSLPITKYRTGNFVWTDSSKTAVEFRDDPSGKWRVSWMPIAEKRNKYESLGGHRHPLFKNEGGIGVDPFDHNVTVEKRNSNGAITVFRRFNPAEPTSSNCFVCIYAARPSTSLEFYDDVLKTATFYGYEALIENQKIGCINHFKNHGYYGYVKKTKHSEFTKTGSKSRMIDGISTAGDMTREALIDSLHLYIYDFIGSIDPIVQMNKIGIPEHSIANMFGNCPFDDLLEDWLLFERDNWTKYDLTVASCIARLCVQSMDTKEMLKGRVSSPSGGLFPIYSVKTGKQIA